MKKLLGIFLIIFGFFAAFFEDENEFNNQKKAAEQGDADAQFSLGNINAEGRGVAQDYRQAVYW